jgi:putative spermidine/putrescine transport system substrate-binding protein
MTDKMTRRRFGKSLLGAGAATLAAPALFGLNAVAQIRRGDELVVGIWGGAQERITRQHIVKPLEDKYGVKINYVLGGTPERRARAYQERGRPSFDLLYLNIFESRQAVKDGVTQAANLERVPNAKYLYEPAKLGGYGVALNPCTIVYDKRKGKISSWKDLWNPEWKGRIAWPSYPGAQGTSGLLMSAKVWGGSERQIDPGFAKIREAKPFAAIQSSQDQLYTMFDQGVADISIEFGSFTRSYAESRNPNIEIANPVEGQALTQNVACPTVGTTKQALVEAFIDLHLSEACQLAYAREIYYSPTVGNLNIPADLAPKLVLGDDVKKLVDFDWEYVISQQSAWSSRFNREIAG